MERGSGEESCCPDLVGDLGVPGGQYRTEGGYNVRHADRATCSRLFKLMEHVRQLNEGSVLSARYGQPLHPRDLGQGIGTLLTWTASLDENV